MKLEELLENFAEIARDEILADFTPDCCIASTRITIEVMRNLGIKARPMPVKAVAINPALTRKIDEHGWPEVWPEDWEADDSLWCVALGYGYDGPIDPEKDYDGHLVALVAGKYLVDASIDQAERIHHDIELPDVLIVPLREGFVAGRRSLGAELPNGGVVVYWANGDDDGTAWRTAPDWKGADRTRRAIRAITEHLKRGMQ